MVKQEYHEAVRVWLDWRRDAIPFYATVGEMPLATAIGYQYLCNQYGKQDLTPHRDKHDEDVAQMKAMIATTMR